MSVPAATRPLGLLAAALVLLLPTAGAAGAQEPGGPGEPDTTVPPGAPAGPETTGGEAGSTGEPGATGLSPEPPDDSFVPADPDVVTLLDQTTWTTLGDSFTMTLSPGRLPEDATLTVEVRRPFTTRAELHQSYFGTLPGARVASPIDQPVGELPRDGDNNLTVAFGVDRPAFDAGGGVHPVEVTAHAPDGELLAHLVTYLLVAPLGEFREALPVGVVIEMGGPPAQQPDGEVVIPEDLLAHLLQRVDLLERLGGRVRLSAAPVPETIDSLLREQGPDSTMASTLGSSLRPHEVLARPYVDLDLDQWAATPELITQAPPEAEAGAEVVRRTIGVEPAPNVWLAGPSVSPTEAATWVDLGVTHAVLDPDALTEIDAPPQSVSPLVQIPEGPVAYVSDASLVARMGEANDPRNSHRVVTELAMLWFEQPSSPRPVAVRVPADEPLDPGQLATALEAAEATGVIDLIPVTELFSRYGPDEQRIPADVQLAPRPVTDSLDWMPGELAEARTTLAGVAGTIGADGTALAPYERALLIAPGADVRPSHRRAYLATVDGVVDELGDSIHVPEMFRITLTDRDGVIPLTITNELDAEVTLRVDLNSNQLEFRDGEQMEVTVEPGSTRFDIRVRTRTSGSFPLHISLTSPDGQVVFDETTFDIRSTAISGVGLVLSIGAGAFLVIWWARHWRRTRRERQAEQPAEA